MKKPTMLVTGATGLTGSAVVSQLRAKDYPVRAVVHSTDRRSDQLRQLGAEIVVADLTDPGQMSLAVRGANRAYFCPPIAPFMIQAATAFAIASQEAKLESVVGLTQWLASPSHPALQSRQHFLVDRLLAFLPATQLTVLAPGLFADTPYLKVIETAAHLGLYTFPAKGSSRDAPPSAADIARVAVSALLDPDSHAGETYRPTGPKLLSIDDIASILGRVFKRKVRHLPTPLWMFYKGARMAGLSPYLLSEIRYYMEDLDAGAFQVAAPTNHVLEVTGTPPEDFETVARRHAASLSATRGVGATIRELARFMSVPFRPGLNPTRFTREHMFPEAFAPTQVMQSKQWQEGRASIFSPTRAIKSVARG
jgi:uncharacterized protein YbjT (DUF2867 family)